MHCQRLRRRVKRSTSKTHPGGKEQARDSTTALGSRIRLRNHLLLNLDTALSTKDQVLQQAHAIIVQPIPVIVQIYPKRPNSVLDHVRGRRNPETRLQLLLPIFDLKHPTVTIISNQQIYSRARKR